MRWALASLLICCAGADRQRKAPPPARSEPFVETRFRLVLHDPYRWMETGGAELTDWMKAQAAFTRAELDALPGRAALGARVSQLSNAGDRIFAPQSFAGRVFYLKLASGGGVPLLCTRAGQGGAERLLVDPKQFDAGGQHAALDSFAPSWDGLHVVFGVSLGGSEAPTLRVVETDTGRLLPDAIDRAHWTTPVWTADSSGFFYARRPLRAPGAPSVEAFADVAVFLHRLGADPAAAAPLFGHGAQGAPVADPNDTPAIVTHPGSPWAIASLTHGVKLEQTIYAARADELLAGRPRWVKVADVDRGVTGFELHGDALYLLNHRDAPRFRVTRLELTLAGGGREQSVLPEGAAVLTGLVSGADALYVLGREGGASRLWRVPHGGEPQPVPLPAQATVTSAFANAAGPGALFLVESWVLQPTALHHDGSAGLAEVGLAPKVALDLSRFQASSASARSADGTAVPCTIVAARDLVRDGSHAALLEVYGAYGAPVVPRFDPRLLAWLERGGVYAQAHARGGGDFGEAWHEAARKGGKQRTTDDLIACARLLMAERISSPARLGLHGRSAGAIPVSMAIEQHPELFAAAISEVGATNLTRIASLPGGAMNFDEFGDPEVDGDFHALYQLDAQAHLTLGIRAPAVLVTTGLNDSRVPPWMAAKYAAGLQRASVSGKPVLLRVELDAGHGPGATRQQADDELADELAFLLWQMGDPAFQPGADQRR